MVNATGNSSEFHRQDVIQDINSRLDHLSPPSFGRRTKKDIVKLIKHSPSTISQIKKWLIILNERCQNNNSGNAKQTASVNATTSRAKGNAQARQPVQPAGQSQSMVEHIANSPPKDQPRTWCGICDLLHETSTCQTLANIRQRQSEKVG